MTNKMGTQGEWITAAVILVVGIPVAWWFTKSSPPEPTVPHTAIVACQDHVKKDAMHPSSVKFSLAGQGSDITDNGAYRVRLGFTAKNSFGMELRMDSLCMFEPGSSTHIASYRAWEKS